MSQDTGARVSCRGHVILVSSMGPRGLVQQLVVRLGLAAIHLAVLRDGIRFRSRSG